MSLFFVVPMLCDGPVVVPDWEQTQLLTAPHEDKPSLTYNSLLGPVKSMENMVRWRAPQPSVYGTATSQGLSKLLVMSRMANEDITWTKSHLPGVPLAVYTANEPTAILHPPANKGHEMIQYMSYIIDNYGFDMPDVMIFVHAHRFAHHNNELLRFDIVNMIKRLSLERIVSHGYLNLNCQWKTGCPAWLHLNENGEDLSKQEQTFLARSWHELFPLDTRPLIMSQPCCSQFAVSRNRVLSIPLRRYVFYRDWLLRTPLTDYISGRIWEFIWQHVFTGRDTYCMPESECYCKSYNICPGDQELNDDTS